jgi:hypothetical protein
MDRAMTQQPQPKARELCPHLAAAVLWMSKNTRVPRADDKGRRYGRVFGSTTDDLLAL